MIPEVARGKATISKINQKEKIKFAVDYVAKEITFLGTLFKSNNKKQRTI